jgi:hypothetical protein
MLILYFLSALGAAALLVVLIVLVFFFVETRNLGVRCADCALGGHEPTSLPPGPHVCDDCGRRFMIERRLLIERTQ